MINTQNTAGYNTNTQTPGTFQRFIERYLEHLQIPYDLVDVTAQAPPDLSSRQLIISGHASLSLSAAWQTAISNAVTSGVGFVNLDSDPNVGQQAHIQAIFAATGSNAGSAGTSITIPAGVLYDGASPHYITALQRRFRNDPAGAITYTFHTDQNGNLQTVTSTVLTGASGTVLAQIGNDPLIRTTTFGQGRAVHFGTLDYLRADRFGFLMGVDDLFWRSLVWAARKPFVVRGFPRFFAVQMDDTLPGWVSRVQDLYNTTLTGQTAPDGTGGPWKVTGYTFIDHFAPGSAERAAMIAAINAGNLQVSPHSHGADYGSLYWETLSGAELTQSSWAATLTDIQNWMTGNGGADTIPFISRSMVPHFWNLKDFTGYDMWNTLGFRYITAIQRPGIDFFSKADSDRLRLRPFHLYQIPPFSVPDENFPIYIADSYTVNSRTGQPAQTFFNFTTQIIDLTRYDRQDLAWPNTTRPMDATIDQFQYYAWRLWSSLAPVEIYTHDGSSNLILSTPAQRQQVIQTVSPWLSQNGVRHVFMEDLLDYVQARTRTALTAASTTGNTLSLTFTGDTTTDGGLITTQTLLFNGDNEGTPLTVSGFTNGSTQNYDIGNLNPVPILTSLNPATTQAEGNAFTLTLTGSDFVSGSVVLWNGSSRTTTYISATQLTASITAADIAAVGTAQVTVSNPSPGGGLSGAQTFTITGNPVPATSGLTPSTLTSGGAAFTLTVTGSNFITGSIVRWNDSNRPTTYISATQLQAAITAADIATAGTAQVTVLNLTPGGGTSNAQAFPITSTVFLDDFTRANSAAVGNGWIEKGTGAAFSIASNAVSKAAAGTNFLDNLVYRPTSEAVLDGEASVEVRFAGLPPGYPQLFVRGQTGTIATAGVLDCYLLYIDNSAAVARLDRIQSGSFVPLTSFTLSPTLNTADTFRLRLRAMGTNPVVLSAYVERFSGTNWTTVGQTTYNDSAAGRFAAAGTVGFSGHTEVGFYTYDNFTRTSFDEQTMNPVPSISGLNPTVATAGGSQFTLTVTGSNFINGSVVNWNGGARTTTFVSATQLQATIPATDIATAGTATVTVFNPTPGGGTSNAQSFTITSGSGTFLDDFNRANNAALGNGWIEKGSGAAFALTNNAVPKAATSSGYADNLVYRPSGEVMLDGEASVELRFASLPPNYPQLLVRGQMNTIATTGVVDGYLLYIDNSTTLARIDRLEGGNFAFSTPITLSPALNTTDTFRLRLRATGTNPVVLNAYVEQFTMNSWQIIGQATVNDTAATRWATSGTVGFSGHTEGGLYTYDNFTRTSLDGQSFNPTPSISGLNPTTATAGGPQFTLTVTGSNFINGSVVRWNGTDRQTTYVNATQLTAAIAADDITTVGTTAVTVFNPAPGGGTASARSFTVLGTGITFFDDFTRANGDPLGNGWIEKTAATFTLADNAVTKAAAGSGFANNLVYRPTGEVIVDDEASVEVRFASMPPAYAQVFVRGQMNSITTAGVFNGYLLFTDNDPTRVLLDRIENGQFRPLVQLNLSPGLNNTDTFRLRLRATGTNPVVLTANVEWLTATGWQVIGTTTYNDTAATRFTTAGTVGFTGYVETGIYTYDNFTHRQ